METSYIANLDYKGTSLHYLVSTDEGADGLKLEVVGPDRIQELDASGDIPNQKVKLVVHPGQELVSEFDAEMIRAAYAERVAVGAVGDDRKPVASCASFLEFSAPKRVKSTLELNPSLKPVGYKDGVVCYTKCSKKRFRSTVNYQPKYRPRAYGETQYVLPQCTTTKYVSSLDYGDSGPAQARKWYTSTISLVPRTYSHNTIHNFQLRHPREEEADESDASDDSDEEGSTASCVSGESDNMNSPTVVQTSISGTTDHNMNIDHNIMMKSRDVMMDNESHHLANDNRTRAVERDSGYGGSRGQHFGVTNGYTASDDEIIDEL